MSVVEKSRHRQEVLRKYLLSERESRGNDWNSKNL